MTAEVTIAALTGVWAALAEACRANWPNLYWQLLDCLRDYLAAADDEARAQAADRMLRVLHQDPEARPIVGAELRRLRSEEAERRLRAARGEPARDSDLLAQVQRIVALPTVSRYTDVLAPAQVSVGKRFAVIVGLTRNPSDQAQDAQELRVEPNAYVRVVLTPHPSLEMLSEDAQTLRVEADRDSAPVVFYLRAREAGIHHMQLDFYEAQTLLASQGLSVEATTGPASEALGRLAGVSMQLGGYLAPHPDLVLRVTTLGNRLTYQLHFSDMRMLTITGPELRADPRTFRQNLMERQFGFT